MNRVEKLMPLGEMLDNISDRAIRFECARTSFFAVPQEDWMTAQTSRADMKHLHRHIVGRLEIGGMQCVVFGREPNQNGSCVEASIAQILTRRELQVAMLVAQGKVDKEIARKLGISDHTVREHLRRACAKLSVSKRSALVATILRPSRSFSGTANAGMRSIGAE